MAKVLITGGTGMVGRSLIAHKGATTHEILAPDRSRLDLQDKEACISLIADYQPDLIIHAAGRVGGIQANIASPVKFLVENLDLGRNIVMAAYAAGVPRLINLGSSCMYPRDANNPLTEDCLLTGPLEPTNEGYALAKYVVARLCEYISSTEDLCYRTVIPCNLYGPYDKFDPDESHLVAGIIYKIHHAQTRGHEDVEIWGDGSARREFLFSTDLAEGIWHMAERMDDMPSMVNLGFGQDHSVLDYYRFVAEIIGWNGVFNFNLDRPIGVNHKLVDTTRQNALGWSPTTSLPDGIAITYKYFLTLPEASL